ncbi:hypothetical protein FVO59_05455 [Microbacterium esteraromaticum]|uniref:Uncharacterized protein n=1 Tax=Microbacterium esteraromaticum TaxID=57043 RepID=A0A7D8AIC7_9MICO|nr:hypothetical protein [Microbacterium esteraromaticum]QMU96725.1 hypothetical protein FVO59_05455 [Microbacterium esteraromaticum]
MHLETTGRRIPAVYLWGAFLVLAWALLTAFTGGDEARADDEPAAPLSGLTSLVGDTIGDVVTPVVQTTTSTVEQAAAPVVQTVEKVVAKTTGSVAQVPIVGAPVAQTVSQAGGTVSAVTETVGEIASSSPVSAIVTPVTDAVGDVPVIGAVLEGLGATDLVDEVATGVDGVLAVVPPVVDSTVDPIVDGLQPSIPGTDEPAKPGVELPPAPHEGPASAVDVIVGSVVPPVPEAARQSAASGPFSSERGAGARFPQDVGARQFTPSHSPAVAPALAPAVATSSASGGGGPAPGASSDGPSSARVIQAMSTRSGIPADAALPPSPAGSTDVSPD